METTTEQYTKADCRVWFWRDDTIRTADNEVREKVKKVTRIFDGQCYDHAQKFPLEPGEIARLTGHLFAMAIGDGTYVLVEVY